MLIDKLKELKENTTESEFRAILAMTEQDIKFNRTFFNKVTTPQYFLEVCNRSLMVLRRC
ncbi:MAG: hypothetical protein E6940_10620 [Clostridium septicum]|uniref:hypothetical protein n=1 Tax=Clostridium septicum TaxID=1504 RepID=UPI00258CFE39|nr:hypothetical protein [Clostridium septicum]MDU1314497.1 hypothetical protein [Clostridium septicum]